VARARRSVLAGAEPLTPRRKWRAITISTLLLVPGYLALLIGLVAEDADARNAPAAAPYIAFGVAMLPFVFLVLAFLSEHPRPASATVKALGLTVLVGSSVWLVAPDAVTPFIAGTAAGGIAAIRADLPHRTKTRALAIIVVCAVEMLLLRTVTSAALLIAPALPFTTIGVADHLAERSREHATS
jgi:hypothetical protein